MPNTSGELARIKNDFAKVYLLKDDYIIKILCAHYITHIMQSDPVWIVLTAASGGLKCLGRGTPILMYDGSVKPVEKIIRGELIMGDDSTPRKVSETTQGYDQLFEIKQKRGISYVVNSAHILSLKQSVNSNRYRGYKYNSTMDIPLSDYLNKSNSFKKAFKGYKNPVQFKKRPIKIDPYFLGLWLGDGRRDCISITTPDKEIVSFLHQFAKKNTLKVTTKNYGGMAQAYNICNIKRSRCIKNPIKEVLKYYGLMPAKFIPNDYKINSTEIRLQILAGLLDTDGTLKISDGPNRQKNSKNFMFTSKDIQLAEDVVFVTRSLGLHASIRQFQAYLPNKKEKRSYWRVYIGGNISIIPTRIKRKQAQARKQVTNHQVTSFSVKPLGMGQFFGFSVNGNGRFLLGDFTVTHNSELINTFSTCKYVHPLSTLTGNTFVSGVKLGGGKTASLLLNLSKDTDMEGSGIISFKDLTSLLSENDNTRSVLMAQLREIYDGKLDKQYGTGDTVHWKGKVTILAGSTHVIHSMKQRYAAMGERFLFYDLIQPDRFEAAVKSIENQEGGELMKDRQELAERVRTYVNDTITLPETLPKISTELRNNLVNLAEMATRARSDVQRDYSSPQKEIITIHPPEMPTRFVSALITFARALVIINWNETGEAKLLDEDYQILYKITLDSVTPTKRRAMQELAKYDILETSGLATKLDMPTNTTRRWLEDLTALGIAIREKGAGNKGDRWKIKPHYRELIEKFEHISREGAELNDSTAESPEDQEQLLAEAEALKVEQGIMEIL